MLPSSFKPQSVDEFIGCARQVAHRIETLTAASMVDGAPLKILLLGQPGIGKSALGDYLMRWLHCDRWHTTVLNGTQVKIEVVEDLARTLHYKELFGTYRLIRIEEVDKVPVVAQVRFLTLLDELPAYSAVLCTSNCKLEDLEDRFQSRFVTFQVAPPAPSEIESLLRRVAPAVPVGTIKQIATFACGNVRQALLDADAALSGQAPLLAV